MADNSTPKQPRSALEELIYQSLLKVENILQELSHTATSIEKGPEPVKCEESIQMESSQDLLAAASTQNGSETSSSAKSLASVRKLSDGIVMDVNVKLRHPSEEEKLIKMSIECPDFKPKRILFGGKWLKIQPAIN